MPLKNQHRRAALYAKDIEAITGRKRTTVRKLIRNIRLEFKKERHEFITVREFSAYTSIPEETVYRFLNY